MEIHSGAAGTSITLRVPVGRRATPRTRSPHE
jgi:hypothetical protein